MKGANLNGLPIDNQNKISQCPYFFDHTKNGRIARNEKDIQDLWKALDGMRNILTTNLIIALITLLGIVLQFALGG